jgi:predicted DNA-binding transcriptional regulator AlpA
MKGGRNPVGYERLAGGVVEPRLLKAIDLADLLQISEREIWRMRDSGRLPATIDLGPKNIRWSREEILGWIEAGCPRRQDWEAKKSKGRRGTKGD